MKSAERESYQGVPWHGRGGDEPRVGEPCPSDRVRAKPLRLAHLEQRPGRLPDKIISSGLYKVVKGTHAVLEEGGRI